MIRVVGVFFFVLVLALCTAARGDSLLDKGYPFVEEDALFQEINGNGVYTTSQESQANSKTSKIRKDLERDYLIQMARKTNLAISGMMKIGYLNLKRRGFHEEARWLQQGWWQHEGDLERIVSRGSYDIGDFKPLSMWLAMAYEVLEFKLTYGICYALRLTDIKSLNFGLVVTFAPCQHGLDEFMKHTWTGDPKYRSVVPLVTYWVVNIGCSIATFGAGTFWLCGPIGMLCELGMNKLGPYVGPKIYNAVCEEVQ